MKTITQFISITTLMACLITPSAFAGQKDSVNNPRQVQVTLTVKGTIHLPENGVYFNQFTLDDEGDSCERAIVFQSKSKILGHGHKIVFTAEKWVNVRSAPGAAIWSRLYTGIYYGGEAHVFKFNLSCSVDKSTPWAGTSLSSVLRKMLPQEFDIEVNEIKAQ